LPSATSGPSEGGLPVLAVIGVQNEVKDKQWRDDLIGFGLSSQIAQTFYNTRRFRLVEARPEVLEQIEKMVEETWADPKAVATAGDLAQVAAALGVDYLAAGRVRSSSKRASGGGIGGVIGVSRQTTTVSVEINLFHRQTGQTDTAKGSGEVSDNRTTVWVQRDLHNLPFDHTTVGRATREAIREAVKKLVPDADWNTLSPPSEGGAGGGTHEGGAGGGTGSWTVGLLPLPRPLSAAVEKQYPELADHRVALGVHNRLVKALSATGRFTFVEIDEEVRQVLEQMRYIRETGTVPDEEALKKLPDFDWPDWILVAEVSDFAKDLAETDNLSGKTQDRVTLQIQIRALNLPQRAQGDLLVTGQGQAKGDWLKWKGEENFEQTFIGAAIDQALRQAVPALLAELGQDEG
jgi:curli biogenesis system outer membrane secretion channel CsgG